MRIDTTNPPGNEVAAAEWIYNYLSKEGIDAEIVESAPGRGNVIARLKGSSTGTSLLLLSHLDVVPSQDLDKWEVPPFAGLLKEDGFIWGRGTLDMKGTTAAQLITFIRLYREKYKPKGDIIFAGTADEESGGWFGPGWLLENKFKLIKADNVITEGGGMKFPLKGSKSYVIQVSEKGMYWTRVKSRGQAGHGSMPGPPKDMAIVKMMKVIQKIADYKPPTIINDLFRETVKAMDLPAAAITKRIFTSKRFIKLGMWVARRMIGEEVDNIIYPLVQNKITPTILRAGEKENNIPGLCEMILDARLLPGFDRQALYSELKKILGAKLFDEVELESILDQPGGVSPIGTEFYNRIEQTIGELDPGAKLVPILSPGSTDMLHFRRRGIQAYGFVPLKIDESLTAKEFAAMGHGYNERLSVDNLLFATRFFYELAQKY
ncbi:MAG: M20/M25/M40 family metallo-hydrolase [Candidatus Helarchaeota archaeon]